MPPSGYNTTQSNLISKFLKSISKSLEYEGKKFDLSPSEALEREIQNINLIVNASNYSEFPNTVLLLTKIFYTRILNYNPINYNEFRTITTQIILEIENEVLSIHVPKINIKY